MDLDQDIDVSMIERNLELTPEERIQEHQNALDILLEIEKMKKTINNHESNQSS